MLPKALRTLSVVTLLSTVSGTVFLMNDHGTGPTGVLKSASDTFTASASGSVVPAVFAVDVTTAPLVETADHKRALRLEAVEQQVQAREAAAVAKARAAELRKQKAEARARAEAKAEAAARARAKAAAEKRRAAVLARASRSAQRDPQALARIMVAERGWGSGQFSCLKSLWTKESGWNYRASNPSSGAYGIPQSLPGSKMAGAGADWRTNPATQIRWGLGYIEDRYGTPCGAWGHSQSSGWY